jgi:hypothetical protein
MVPILQSPAVATIDFRLDAAGFAITGQAYWEVAEHIKRCSILVRHMPRANFEMKFLPCHHAHDPRGHVFPDAHNNPLIVPTIGVNVRETHSDFPSLVIHEATHAWHYLHRGACLGTLGIWSPGKCIGTDVESAGFVAQFMYLRQAQPHLPFLQGNPPGHVGGVSSGRAIDDPVFFAALDVADTFLAHHQPTQQMIGELHSAIHIHPRYGFKMMLDAFPACR